MSTNSTRAKCRKKWRWHCNQGWQGRNGYKFSLLRFIASVFNIWGELATTQFSAVSSYRFIQIGQKRKTDCRRNSKTLIFKRLEHSYFPTTSYVKHTQENHWRLRVGLFKWEISGFIVCRIRKHLEPFTWSVCVATILSFTNLVCLLSIRLKRE